MEAWALVMIATLFALLFLGYPVAFTIGTVALVFGGVFLGLEFFELLPLRIWGVVTSFTLIAVPLFVFMGVVLERSGLAGELLETMGELFGRLRGGLGVSVVLVGAVLAATTGVVGATVVTMGVIALPAMLRNHYQPALASGVIAASGTLGQILPPSIILILLGDVMGVPVGQLFMAAVVPGLLLVISFMTFVLLIAWWRPALAPAIRPASGSSGTALGGRVLKSLLPVLLLVIAVLGSIFFGIATPTESAGVGALGALLLAAVKRRLRWRDLDASLRQTVRLTSMVFLVLIGATAFGLVFTGMGGDALVHELLTELPGGAWGFVVFSMALLFVLGFFLDFLEICFLVVPILAPIAAYLGIDPLWYAALIAINLQTSFLTPPFGFSLFYLKAVAPPSVDMLTIYRGIAPFVALQLVALGLVLLFPGLIHWLPELMARWH
jgi:tripartite ATP-independent transporter DctM subunit